MITHKGADPEERDMTDKTEKLKMKFKNFEDFIQQVHCSEFVGLKYNILEDYEDWICDLDVDDWLRYGDLYAKNIRHTDNATLEPLDVDKVHETIHMARMEVLNEGIFEITRNQAKEICKKFGTPDIDSMLKEFDEVYIGSSAQRIKQWLREKLGGSS